MLYIYIYIYIHVKTMCILKKMNRMISELQKTKKGKSGRNGVERKERKKRKGGGEQGKIIRTGERKRGRKSWCFLLPLLMDT
jgi:hypothetical protein